MKKKKAAIKSLKVISFITKEPVAMKGGGTCVSLCVVCPIGPSDDTLDFGCTTISSS